MKCLLVQFLQNERKRKNGKRNKCFGDELSLGMNKIPIKAVFSEENYVDQPSTFVGYIENYGT